MLSLQGITRPYHQAKCKIEPCTSRSSGCVQRSWNDGSPEPVAGVGAADRPGSRDAEGPGADGGYGRSCAAAREHARHLLGRCMGFLDRPIYLRLHVLALLLLGEYTIIFPPENVMLITIFKGLIAGALGVMKMMLKDHEHHYWSTMSVDRTLIIIHNFFTIPY